MKNNLNSIELLTQTQTGSLVWNSFLNTIGQTKDLNKAWDIAAEMSNKNNFTIPFWLTVGLDILKLVK
jgi:hypothetical protein